MKKMHLIGKGSVVLVLALLMVGMLAIAAFAYDDWEQGTAAASGSGNVKSTIEFQQADIQDVLSALAVKTGTTIILGTEDPQAKKVNFEAQGIGPYEALNLIVQKQGMQMLQKGDIIIVGKADDLKKNWSGEMMFTRIDTNYVRADKIVDLIEDFNVENIKVYAYSGNPNTVWAEGTAQGLTRVRGLVNGVDIPENQASLEYKTITPTKISTKRMITLLGKAGVTFTRYVEVNKSILVFDHEYFARWNQITRLAKQLDVTSTTTDDKVIVYRCKYISAKDAATWLNAMKIGDSTSDTTDESDKEVSSSDIKTITFNNDAIGTDLTVVCPAELESQVISALNQIDVKRQEVKVPLLKASYQKCNAVRVFVNELTGVSVSKLHISSDLAEAGTTSPSKEYVLWVEESPDKVKLIQDVLDEAGV